MGGERIIDKRIVLANNKRFLREISLVNQTLSFYPPSNLLLRVKKESWPSPVPWARTRGYSQFDCTCRCHSVYQSQMQRVQHGRQPPCSPSGDLHLGSSPAPQQLQVRQERDIQYSQSLLDTTSQNPKKTKRCFLENFLQILGSILSRGGWTTIFIGVLTATQALCPRNSYLRKAITLLDENWKPNSSSLARRVTLFIKDGRSSPRQNQTKQCFLLNIFQTTMT